MSLNAIKLEKRDLLTAFLGVLVIIVSIPVFTYLYFARDLSTKEGIMNRNNTGVTLLDVKDRPFFTFYQAKKITFVPLTEIPKHAQEAVIAVEDKDFYSHPGFSIKAITRSFYLDITQKELAYGGSTITQQLVKNSLLNPKKSFLRKYQELILAQEIERRHSKEEILEMYLNSVYFGEGAFGIEEASQEYFGKSAKDLNLAESAILTGLLPSPNALSPFSNEEGAFEKQEIVLQKMLEQGYITEQEKEVARETKLIFVPREDDLNRVAPHFALMAKQELEEKYGEERISRSGFTVKTTIDLDLQKYAEEVVSDQVARLKPNNVSNGAALVLDPKTGEIRALVGSKDWYDDQFGKLNIVTAQRPPGSSFKPIVYAKALEDRVISPSTILKDESITYEVRGSPPYQPQNYDRRFRGQVLPRRALANSLNVPSVEIMSKLGVPAVVGYSKNLGITTLSDNPTDYGLSLVLGTGNVQLLQLTNAYAAFANGGYQAHPTTISLIKDKKGQTIYTHKPDLKKVLDENAAFIISSFLSDKDARAEVFGSALNISRVAAVKTGTTEDYKDAWTLGYTPSVVVGVWVGNNDNKPMDRVAGSLGAAPIWKALMERFLKDSPEEKFTPPDGLVSLSICKNNGLVLREKITTSSANLEYYLPGTEPKKFCTISTPKPTSSSTPDGSSMPTPSPQQSTPDPKPQGNSESNDNVRININGQEYTLEQLKQEAGNKKKQDNKDD